MAYEPLSVTCTDGIVLKGRRYSTSNVGQATICHRIICLHGWMDNCRTFWKLAPALMEGLSSSEASVELIALDLPGHGHSSHKSLDGPSMVLMDYVYYLHEALQSLQWEPETVTLIGHSMGGAVSLMYSAAFPTQRLIMLDSLGPHVLKDDGGAPKHLRTHIKARLRGKAPSSVYESLEKAVEVRMLTATTYPGNQYISKEAAKELVQGASRILEDGQLEFLHDQRLKLPSILYLTQEQVDEMYKAVAASSTRVCLLLAQDGMPFPAAMITHARETINAETVEVMRGSHHFHADPDSAAEVANTILTFLR